MNNEEYSLITELECKGEEEKAFQLLERLANEDHPMALLDLSLRYYSIEGHINPVHPLDPDFEKSESLAKLGKKSLEKMALTNDGEAMRMLAYCYFGYWGPYLNKNIEQAKFYYKEAERHDCRFIYNVNLET